MKRISVAILFAFIATLVLVISVLAQDGQPEAPSDDAVNAIAKQLYCPVCENIPLDVCGTQACAQWRELIREKLAMGWSESEIKQYFVTQYGDRVLASPPARGLNWLVYIIPPLAIIAGIYILYRAFQSWRRPEPQATPGDEPEVPSSDEYVIRLEDELKNR